MKAKHFTYIPFFIFFSACHSFFAQCGTPASSGGTGFTDNACAGWVSWSNPANAQTSDDSRSAGGILVGILGSATTHYLDAEGFNFSVPANASICGVEVSIEHRQQGVLVGSSVRDDHVQLVKAGVPMGNDRASLNDWGNSDEIYTYGGPADTWGYALTPADVNAPDFGVVLSATLRAGLAAVFLSAEVDYITMTVYYDLPLPVEFLYFDADLLGNGGVALKWKTATEVNNNYFAVERSGDATCFEQMDLVKGAGNSQQAISYSALDRHPFPGFSYYRLRQVDYNGSSSYSAIRSVFFEGSSGIASAGFFNGNVHVKLLVPQDMPVEITVTNIAGTKIRSVKTNLQAGSNEIKIAGDGIPSGVYIVSTKLGYVEHHKKFYVVTE